MNDKIFRNFTIIINPTDAKLITEEQLNLEYQNKVIEILRLNKETYGNTDYLVEPGKVDPERENVARKYLEKYKGLYSND
jgi:hypothetical protein